MHNQNGVLSYDQVVALLRDRTKNWGAQGQLAKSLGVNPCQFTTFLTGKVHAGTHFMRKLGYLRVVYDAAGKVVSDDDIRAVLRNLVAANGGSQQKVAQMLRYAQPSICAALHDGCHISEGIAIALGFSIGYIDEKMLQREGV